MMRKLLASLMVLVLTSNCMAAEAVEPRASTVAPLVAPPGWTRHILGEGFALDSPEGDAHVAIIPVDNATDAESAAANAWRSYRGVEVHRARLLTPMPVRDGWDERVLVQYEASPSMNEQAWAHVLREGTTWTVALVDGSQSTLAKRRAAVDQIVANLRPASHVRESFAGRTPRPLDPARVGVLLEFVRASAERLKIPGVGIALIDDGRIVFEGGIGVREAGRPERVDAHTRFQIASNTKGMTTLLLARLVDQGKLAWDDPVTKVYPSFRLGSEATTRQVLVRHLVCACTGVPRKDFEIYFRGAPDTPASTVFDLLAATEPTSGFGELFQYNNLMAAAAGYVGAHVLHPHEDVGAAYDKAMKALVFAPLGMHETTFDLREVLASNHASPHGVYPDGQLRVEGLQLIRAITAGRPGGGAWSTAHDMIRYVRNELTQGVLPDGTRPFSAQNLLMRRARGVSMGEALWYGMGLMEDASSGVSVIRHGGALPGFRSQFIAIPSAQVGAVILTNADDGQHLLRAFQRRLLELLYDGNPEAEADLASEVNRIETQRRAERATLRIPPPSSDLEGLADFYDNPALGRLTVERSGPVTRIRAGSWAGEVASRRDEDGTTSLVLIDPEFSNLTSAFRFVIGSQEGRRTLTISDAQHAYVFVESN